MRPLRPLRLAFPALFLNGCLYTSHHFNTGRVLEPGNTAVTVGWGKARLYEEDCPDNAYGPFTYGPESGRCMVYGDSILVKPIVSSTSIPKFSLGYRLGVRRDWGPFTGVELGWHIEVPTNPGSAEFDAKFGLPAPERYFHSLSGGWIIGSWADNSVFGEYAASRGFGKGDPAHSLYASYRLTYLATQPSDAVAEDSLVNRFNHRRRFAHQATAGFLFRLPAFPVLPDFFSPHATVSMPVVPAFDGPAPDEPFLLDLNFGVGWRF